MALTTVSTEGIKNGTIKDEDVKSDAAIALSKLASTPAVLTGSTNNTICTVTGANAFKGNSDLLWNGSRLDIDTGGTEDALRIGNTAGADTSIRLGSISTDPDTHAVIKYDKDDNYLSLLVSGEAHGAGGILIANGGSVGIKNSSPGAQYYNNLVVGDNSSGDWGITIRTSSSNKGVLAFSDTDSADANRYDGYIAYEHNNQAMVFYTAGANERFSIDSSGNVEITDGKVLIRRTSSGYGGAVIAAQAPSGQAASLLLHRGSNASNADVLGIVHFNDQNDYTGCQIRATATENWSGSAHGSELGFYTTDNTTTTNDQRLRITHDGNVGIGAITGDVDRLLHLESGSCFMRFTNPATSTSNGDIMGMIEFEHKDSNTPGIAANIRSEMVDTSNGACSLFFSAGTPSTIGTRMEIQSGGDVKINDGNLIFADGHGLNFNATADASGTGVTAGAELFNDYEEGTWTPELKFGGNTTGITYSSQYGCYTRIGRMVFLNGVIALSDSGTATGDAEIDGFPWSIGNNIGGTSVEGAGYFSYWAGMGYNRPGFLLRGTESTTKAIVSYNRADGYSTLDVATQAEFTDSTSIRFQFEFAI